MVINKAGLDKALAVLAAVTAPVLTFCVHQHWLGALSATDLGLVVTAALGSYHGGAAVANRATRPTVPVDGP